MIYKSFIALLLLNSFQIRTHDVLLLRLNLRTWSNVLLLLLVIEDLEITLVVVQLGLRVVLRRNKLATVPQVSRRSLIVKINYINLLLATIEHAKWALVHHALTALRKTSLLHAPVVLIAFTRAQRRAHFVVDSRLQLAILVLLIQAANPLIACRQSRLQRHRWTLVHLRLFQLVIWLESFANRNLTLVSWLHIVRILVSTSIAHSRLL